MGERECVSAGLSPSGYDRSRSGGFRIASSENITTRKNQLDSSDYQIFLYQVLT
jgi:hypothetical protein